MPSLSYASRHPADHKQYLSGADTVTDSFLPIFSHARLTHPPPVLTFRIIGKAALTVLVTVTCSL